MYMSISFSAPHCTECCSSELAAQRFSESGLCADSLQLQRQQHAAQTPRSSNRLRPFVSKREIEIRIFCVSGYADDSGGVTMTKMWEDDVEDVG